MPVLREAKEIVELSHFWGYLRLMLPVVVIFETRVSTMTALRISRQRRNTLL